MRRSFVSLLLLLSFAIAACGKPSSEPAVTHPDVVPARSAEQPVSAPPPAPTPEAAEPTPIVDASAPAEPPPKVKVVTIGMHVAGGPFDEPTKEPMKRSVEPRFPELALCWKHIPKPQEVDAGVDLMIEAEGGKAKISNPRTTLKAEGFLPCVIAFFESVEFQKPKFGRTGVSYSVRFLPK